MKQCSKCKQWKPKEKFSKHKYTRDGFRSVCRKCASICAKEAKQKNRERHNNRKKRYYRNNIKRWYLYFLKENPNPKCGICGKVLYYYAESKGKKQTTHFDHVDNIPIKYPFFHWSARHPPTPKNISIFKSCNFGILCYECNKKVPTKNRKEWIKNLCRYVGLKILY